MNAPLREASVEPAAELFAEHGNLIYRTLQYLGVPSASVDDALQDVFITAHRRWDSFDGRASPRTWLYGIARRVAWRYRRNHKTRGARFVLTERPVEGAVAPFEQANARRSVQALLEQLDDDKRAAFVLVEVEGFTAPEAAELLEIPLGTVYSRVRAAWARLRDAARDDVQVDVMRAELEPERRATVQRALLAASLPAAQGVGTATAGLGSLGWLWGAGAAGVLAVGIALAIRADDPRPPPPAVQLPAEPVASPIPRAPQPARTAPLQEPIVDSEPPPPVEPVAEPEPAPRKRRAKPKPRPDTPPNTLAAEAKLIRRAKELMRDGKPDQARAVLDDHASRFPSGQLRDERDEVRQRLDRMGP